MTTGAEQSGAGSMDLNPIRTKRWPRPGPGTPGAAGESDSPVTADPVSQPAPSHHPISLPTTEHAAADRAAAADTQRLPPTMRGRWVDRRRWPVSP